MKKVSILFSILLLGCIIHNLGFGHANAEELVKQPPMKNWTLKSWQEPKLTLLDSVFNYICQSDIVHKDIVIKQVIWETGWLKSNFLMSKNNLFGFRAKEYLTFSSWQASVDYYEKWQNKYYKNPEEDYYVFLVRIKYSNSRYPSHLKSLNYTKTCS